MLTLSDPVFFADRDTGEYTITGTADAGSEILYGEKSAATGCAATAQLCHSR